MDHIKILLAAILAIIAAIWSAPPTSAQSTNYYYVADTRLPDAYLSLRTEPSSSRGQKIMEMPNGTLLEVLEKRDDGWWSVRVVSNGATGWALNRSGDRVWIFCCSNGQTTTGARDNWTEFYYNAGVNVHFYYSPVSIERTGSIARVKWYDNGPKGNVLLVYHAEIDCAHRTILSTSVDLHDAQSGNYQSTTDLSSSSTPQNIDPGTMADHLSQRTCY